MTRIVLVTVILLAALVACGEDATPDPTSTPDASGRPAPATPIGSQEPDVAVVCVPEDVDEGLDVDGVRAGLECAVELFPWPEGKVPDPDLMVTHLPTEGARFGPGFPYAMLAGTNECAWDITWLEARAAGDAALEAEALEMMTNVIPNYRTTISGFPENVIAPDVVQQQREIAQRASLGDPTLVQLFVENNCATDADTWGDAS